MFSTQLAVTGSSMLGMYALPVQNRLTAIISAWSFILLLKVVLFLIREEFFDKDRWLTVNNDRKFRTLKPYGLFFTCSKCLKRSTSDLLYASSFLSDRKKINIAYSKWTELQGLFCCFAALPYWQWRRTRSAGSAPLPNWRTTGRSPPFPPDPTTSCSLPSDFLNYKGEWAAVLYTEGPLKIQDFEWVDNSVEKANP